MPAKEYKVTNIAKRGHFFYNAAGKIVGVDPGKTKVMTLDDASISRFARDHRGVLKIENVESQQELGLTDGSPQQRAANLLDRHESKQIKPAEFRAEATALLGDRAPAKNAKLDAVIDALDALAREPEQTD